MSPSPSFNIFSNSYLAEIAARVVKELRVEDGLSAANFDEFAHEADILESVKKDGGVENGEFEFALVTSENSELLSTVAADEIFHNGKILPVYPIVNSNRTQVNSGTKIGPPLRKLFAEERKITATSSSSSSDVDELDGVPAETYCVWRPKAAEEGRWKRSSFPVSNSKKWRLKDFLQRSFSVGSKDSFVFLSPINGGKKREEERIKESPMGYRKIRKESFVSLSLSNGGSKNVSINKVKRPPDVAGKSTPPPYNRDSGEKRRSYLPYKQDLGGFFASMNVLGKSLQPF